MELWLVRMEESASVQTRQRKLLPDPTKILTPMMVNSNTRADSMLRFKSGEQARKRATSSSEMIAKKIPDVTTIPKVNVDEIAGVTRSSESRRSDVL